MIIIILTTFGVTMYIDGGLQEAMFLKLTGRVLAGGNNLISSVVVPEAVSYDIETLIISRAVEHFHTVAFFTYFVLRKCSMSALHIRHGCPNL